MVARVNYIIFLCFLCCIMYSCAALGIFPREKLGLKKRNQIENISRLGLRVDGVYIGEHKDGAKAFFVLFNDGLCYLNRRTTASLDTLFYSSTVHEDIRFSSQDSPIGWGGYDIENNIINIIFWSVVQSTIEYNRVEWSGRVMNNETIAIEKGWGIDHETIFNFYPLKNKPDSTNRFIK